MHHHRAEHWVVVKGTARVTRGDDTFIVSENESTSFRSAPGTGSKIPARSPLEIIEVQSGPYLGEDDIVRFEDTYGRSRRSAQAAAGALLVLSTVTGGAAFAAEAMETPDATEAAPGTPAAPGPVEPRGPEGQPAQPAQTPPEREEPVERAVLPDTPSLQMSPDFTSPALAFGGFFPTSQISGGAIRIEPFNIRASANAGLGFTDNVALSNVNKRSSFLFTLAPSVIAGLESESHRLYAVYRGNYGFYTSDSGSSYNTHNFGLQASSDWSERLRSSLRYEFLRGADPRGSTETAVDRAQAWNLQTVRATASYGGADARGRIDGNVAYLNRSYVDDRVVRGDPRLPSMGRGHDLFAPCRPEDACNPVGLAFGNHPPQRPDLGQLGESLSPRRELGRHGEDLRVRSGGLHDEGAFQPDPAAILDTELRRLLVMVAAHLLGGHRVRAADFHRSAGTREPLRRRRLCYGQLDASVVPARAVLARRRLWTTAAPGPGPHRYLFDGRQEGSYGSIRACASASSCGTT